MMKVLLGDENMSKINLSLFLLCSILTACVSDLCYEKTKNLPRGTAEERGKASLATLKCMDDKK